MLGLVLAFRSSVALAYTDGTAVSGTIAITTLLFLYIARTRWRVPLWLIVIGGGALLLVDAALVAANVVKIPYGAWLPLVIALLTVTVMITWRAGLRTSLEGAHPGGRPVARVRPAERVTIDDLGFGDGRILFVTADFGYMEDPDVPAVLELIEPPIDRDDRLLRVAQARFGSADGPAVIERRPC